MNFDLIPSLLSTSTNFLHCVVFPLRSQPSKTISAPLDKTRAIFVVVSAVSVAELPRKQAIGNVSSLDDSLFHIPTGSPKWDVKQSTTKRDRARCSWSQVSAFQHYNNLPLASSLSQSLYSSPQALHPPSVLIRRPSPYYPMPPTPTLPHPTSFSPRPSGPFPCMVSPVDHHFRSGFISLAYTGSFFHCPPLSPFRPSSVLLTSVGSAFIIPFCF